MQDIGNEPSVVSASLDVLGGVQQSEANEQCRTPESMEHRLLVKESHLVLNGVNVNGQCDTQVVDSQAGTPITSAVINPTLLPVTTEPATSSMTNSLTINPGWTPASINSDTSGVAADPGNSTTSTSPPSHNVKCI